MHIGAIMACDSRFRRCTCWYYRRITGSKNARVQGCILWGLASRGCCKSLRPGARFRRPGCWVERSYYCNSSEFWLDQRVLIFAKTLFIASSSFATVLSTLCNLSNPNNPSLNVDQPSPSSHWSGTPAAICMPSAANLLPF